MKKEVSKWPFLGAAALFAANVDYIVIPLILKPLGLSFWAMFCAAALVANVGTLLEFYFWRWFAWVWLPSTEPVKETVEFTKGILEELQKKGLIETIKTRALRTFTWATHPDSKLIGFIKVWSHIGMFILGAESFISGGRLVGTVICASMKWKNGIYSLLIGNTIHIAISVGMWSLFFSLWHKYKGFLMLFFLILLLVVARGYIWKKIKNVQITEKNP